MNDLNPFLGARPYGPADDQIFLGRRAATARLVERIDLRPLTIVTSPSGLGKTSLLRAAVIPELERSGLSPVYLRPDPPSDISGAISDDAATALLGRNLAESMATALLPDPDLEARCFAEVCAAAPAGVTLGQAREWFNELPAADKTRRRILGVYGGPLERLPMLARFLRGSLALEAMAAQAATLNARLARLLGPEMPLVEAAANAFPDHEFELATSNAIQAVCAACEAGSDNLRGAVHRLVGSPEYAPLISRPDGDPEFSVRIVLVLDQFEQVFTLSGPETRYRALQTLVDLLTALEPIHLVLVLRKEWYADLVRLLSQLQKSPDPADRTTYHLEPMTRAEAMEVMVEAPRRTGAHMIEKAQREELWDALQQEDTIDAVALSIACHELFAVDHASRLSLNEAGVQGLLKGYLVHALDDIRNAVDREEALDMLGEIAGSGETRNFTTHTRLLNAPLRDPSRRAGVLDAMQRAFLVKGDSPRQGFDKVYDIMHERLLAPVRELVAARPELIIFREAAERVTQGGAWRGLNWRHCEALLAARTRTVWDSRTAAILLRSLIREMSRERLAELEQGRAGRGSLVPTDERPLDWWRATACELAVLAKTSPSPVLPPADRVRLSWWMTAEEIGRRLTQPANDEADALALVSGLRCLRGQLRNELPLLALRVHGGPAAQQSGGDDGRT